jgi:D-sedoheptulose 7-phosphate isomerase
MSFAAQFLKEAGEIAAKIDTARVDEIAQALADVRAEGGRVFFLGVGGSAGNASHAVNDFRKIAKIECYAPTDNVSELTARTNDEGWPTVFVEWLRTSKLRAEDALFILSVGGGDKERNISANLISAIDLARERGAKVLGIVGKSEGYTANNGLTVVIPIVNEAHITPHSEAFQAVVWHCLVSTRWSRRPRPSGNPPNNRPCLLLDCADACSWTATGWSMKVWCAPGNRIPRLIGQRCDTSLGSTLSVPKRAPPVGWLSLPPTSRMWAVAPPGRKRWRKSMRQCLLSFTSTMLKFAMIPGRVCHRISGSRLRACCSGRRTNMASI